MQRREHRTQSLHRTRRMAKRRSRPLARLAFEPLEERAMLSAIPMETVRDWLRPEIDAGSVRGATIITHGFQTSNSGGDSLLSLAEAIRDKADALNSSAEGAWLLDYDAIEYGTAGFDDVDSVIVGVPTEVIVLFDWAPESNESSAGWAEAAGDALFSTLVGLGLVDPAAGTANPIQYHFIGHSFGTAVTSEAVERLAAFDVPVDQVTYLDPHEFDQGIIPVDGAQELFTLGLPASYGATVWNNVVFADAYYQTESAPDGRPIAGAYNRYVADDSLVRWPFSHSDVWDDLYIGTVNDPTLRSFGYRYSRIADGQSIRPAPTFADTAANPQDHDHSTIPATADYDTFRGAPEWMPLSVNNGDFSYIGYRGGDLPDFVPGWIDHGGDGWGLVEGRADDPYLQLEPDYTWRTHNYLYVPAEAGYLAFDYGRAVSGTDDTLDVYLGNTIVGSISLEETDSDFTTARFPLSYDLRNQACTLSFAIAVGETSVVQIDNVRFEAAGDIRIGPVTTNGTDRLVVNYEILGGIDDPFEIGFYRSTDGVFAVGDLFLENVMIDASEDLEIGVHSKEFEIGSGAGQISLPGAGAAETNSDYFLLVVADPRNLVDETTLPGGETNNTTVLTGVYHAAGGPVMVHGISTRDVIKVSPNTGPLPVRVDFNGTFYEYASNDLTGVRIRGHNGGDEFQLRIDAGFGSTGTLDLLFQGGSGTNTAKVWGSTSTIAKDVARVYPMTGSFTGPSYTLSLAGMRGMTVTSQGGPDEAYVYDSSLDDTFTAYPTYVTLSNSLYTNRAEGFRNVFAYAQVGGAYMAAGGNDVANFYGVASTRDYFRASAMYGIMADAEVGRGTTYFVRGNWFEQVHAYGRTTGGRPSGVDRDQANLFDAATIDLFEAETAGALAIYAYSGASIVSAHTFRVVKAYGAPGDTANLYGPGTYSSAPNPVMYVGDYTVWANGFEPIHWNPEGPPAAPSPRAAAVDVALLLLFSDDSITLPLRKKTDPLAFDLAPV